MELATIHTKIHIIRNVQVMLDYDLAALYDVETKRLKEAVKRNIKRFPPDFMFELREEEFTCLRSQNASSNKRGGTRYMPFAFTEHGVAMLASVLHSDKAIDMSLIIVRAFIALRNYALHYADLTNQIEELRKDINNGLFEHDTQLSAIYDVIEQLLDKQSEVKRWEERDRIGFKAK